MRVVNFLLAAMFMVFAFLQVNDPDPVLWILIYGAMAAVCVMAMFSYYLRSVVIGLIIIYGLLSIVYLDSIREWMAQDNLGVIFDDLAKMEYPYIEESREFLGLMICEAMLFFYLIQSRRRH